MRESRLGKFRLKLSGRSMRGTIMENLSQDVRGRLVGALQPVSMEGR
jgi:hypothetical protein